MAISPQRLTIYLYSAHRAVIFAIAQLSCIENAPAIFNFHSLKFVAIDHDYCQIFRHNTVGWVL